MQFKYVKNKLIKWLIDIFVSCVAQKNEFEATKHNPNEFLRHICYIRTKSFKCALWFEKHSSFNLILFF